MGILSFFTKRYSLKETISVIFLLMLCIIINGVQPQFVFLAATLGITLDLITDVYVKILTARALQQCCRVCSDSDFVLVFRFYGGDWHLLSRLLRSIGIRSTALAFVVSLLTRLTTSF